MRPSSVIGTKFFKTVREHREKAVLFPIRNRMGEPRGHKLQHGWTEMEEDESVEGAKNLIRRDSVKGLQQQNCPKLRKCNDQVGPLPFLQIFI